MRANAPTEQLLVAKNGKAYKEETSDSRCGPNRWPHAVNGSWNLIISTTTAAAPD